MTKPLAGVPRLDNTRAALALNPTDSYVHVDLTGAAQVVTPPTDTRLVVFAATGDFAVQFKHATVAAFPAATDLTPGEKEEVNPAVRFIGDRLDEQANLPAPVVYTFSVVGSGTGVCTIGFYS